MRTTRWTTLLIPTLALGLTAAALGDELRVVKVGQPIPTYSLKSLGDTPIDNPSTRKHALVLVYVAAQQVSSTKVMVESQQMFADLKRDDLEVQYVTADVVQTDWFRDFRDGAGIHGPMGLDFERVLYGKLGIIVLPTTIVVDAKGRLAHVIAGYKPDYVHMLDAYARHGLGMLDDKQLEEHLTARGFHHDTPSDRAARHRAAAGLLREKGLREQAERELRSALEVDPTDMEARLDLAALCIAMERFDEAKVLVEEVMKAEANSRRGKLLRGILLFHDGKLDDAEKALSESLVLNTDPARTHYYLGLVYEKKGQTDKAMEHYRQALERLLDERP